MRPTSVPITFSEGLNTKTDPWQVPIGQFESLQNSIFQKGGLFQKRNGYGLLTSSNPVSSYVTTLNNNLISIGNTVNAYSSTLDEWITKGTLQPCSLSVLPLIKNNINQIQSDTAIANGLVLTVYTQTITTVSAVSITYEYAIADALTGQNIVAPSSLPVISGGTITGSSRAFVVGNYFVVVSQVQVSSNTFLQYFSIPIANPVLVSAAQNVTSEVYVPISSNPGWDGVVSNRNNTLVVAYNTTAGAQGVHVASLTQSQIAVNSATSVIHAFAGSTLVAALLSICVDSTSNSFDVFYISFWNNATTNGFTCAVTIGFGSITALFTPQQVITSVSVANLASASQSFSCLLVYETTNAYAFDNTIPSNFLNYNSISQTGVVGTAAVLQRSVGLASKAFIVNKKMYVLSAYQSTFQPTYFLLTFDGNTVASIVAKLAYENGGGYLTLGLPNVSVNGSVAQISYLFKDLVEALNTLNNPQQLTAGGIYSQTGINLVSFTLGTENIDTAEIASSLHISGGYLSMFDGFLPVEHNFFLWPDNVEISYTPNSTVTPSANVVSGSNILTAVSSVSGVAPGMSISGTGIPSGAIVETVGTTTIGMSVQATGSYSSETITIQGNIEAIPAGGTVGLGAYYYQVTYEWSDNNGLIYRSAPSIPVPVTTNGSAATGSITINVPTLRLTAKRTNPVKIVIYRWSEATGVYNQVTSIIAPLLNSTTADSVEFVDPFADANVVGNNIIYTTGGVVEDVNAPASNIMTIFDTRLWLVDSEDPNLLWVSKQVIENTPVEMSDLFTIYVAPNTGTVSSTGPITALFPMDDKLIIFKGGGGTGGAIYYINGVGPNNLGTTSIGCSLGNYSQPTFITSVVGCTNQQSIVLTQDGLMFQSDKGIWKLGRNLVPEYIGAPVEAFNGSLVNSANVIPDTNYVLFTLNTGQMLMYDYYYGQWGTFIGAPAISSCIYNGLHTILDPFGNILQETPGLYLDNSNPVLLQFTTSWINLASLQGYERFYDFYILAKYLSPHSLLCQVAYDYNSSIVHSKLIQPKNFSPTIPGPFGIPTPFGSPGDREQWKIDAKRQLCESFQLTLTEVFDSTLGATAGAGFTMSGLSCQVGIKKATRPIPGRTSAGLS